MVKMGFLLGVASMFVSAPGVKGHFTRGVWLGLSAVCMSVICYSPSATASSVVGWGLWSNNFSPWLVCLTWFISFLAMVVSSTKISWSSPESQVAYGVAVSAITLVVSLSFLVSNFFWFYVLFEGSLIPMFYLVAGWGSYQERIEATSYMMLYTVGASLPLLMVIAYHSGSLNKAASLVDIASLSALPSVVVCYGCLMAFLVKLPLYPLHLWLPKAHVEAPTAGSMVLAGVMLKLGGFGMVSSLIMFSSYFKGELWLVASVAIFGGAMASGYCLLQVDLKSAIAYSSVAHMSLVIYGAASMNTWGLNSCTMTMVSHGLTSSGLFCLVHWVHDLVGSRLLSVVSGLLLSSRSLGSWGLILLSANVPTPPWFSIVGEVMILPSIMSKGGNFLVLFPVCIMMFLGACFSLVMFVELFQGKPSNTLQNKDTEKSAHLSLWGHVGPLLGLVFFTGKLAI